LRALALFSAILFALCAPASAQSDADFGFFGVHWQVSPQELPDAEIVVDRWEEILQLDLVPAKLFATRADVFDAEGKGLLPAGAQLVGLSLQSAVTAMNSQLSVVCSIDKMGGKAFVSAKKHVCLVDETSDGTFEYWFDRGMSGMWRFAPEIRGKPKLRPLPAVVLEAVEPSQLRNPPRLAIGYQRILDVGNLFSRVVNQENIFTPSKMPESRIRFFFEVYADGKFGANFSDYCNEADLTLLCADAEFPRDVTIAGVNMRLIEREGEKIRLTVEGRDDPVTIRFTPFDGDTYPRTGEYVVVPREKAML
jgi:hypothetical protein